MDVINIGFEAVNCFEMSGLLNTVRNFRVLYNSVDFFEWLKSCKVIE